MLEKFEALVCKMNIEFILFSIYLLGFFPENLEGVYEKKKKEMIHQCIKEIERRYQISEYV